MKSLGRWRGRETRAEQWETRAEQCGGLDMAKDKFERTKPHVNVWAMNGLAQLGFSAAGVHQIATGQIITDPEDRKLAAEILTGAAAPLIARALCSNEVIK